MKSLLLNIIVLISFLSFTGLATAVKIEDVYLQSPKKYEKAIKANEQKDFRTVLSELIPMAESKDTFALSTLGFMYETGEGVDRDYEKAMKYYRQAADLGLDVAQLNTGRMFSNGKGVTKNQDEAIKWYRMAADQGLSDAQFDLALALESGGRIEDLMEAIPLYQKSADQGNFKAQVNLGLWYKNTNGVFQDDGKAFSLFKKAAEQGNTAGQFNLAEMYKNARGTSINLSEAAKFYKLAADKGLQQAIIAFAVMQYKGDGVQQDKTQALASLKAIGVSPGVLKSMGVY